MEEYLIIIFLSSLFLLLLSMINWKAVIITVITLIFSFAMISVISSDLVKYLFKSKEMEKSVITISKILIYAIPVSIILYLLYMNLAPILLDSRMDISLDVGSDKEGLAKGIAPLTPLNRIGDKMTRENISYMALKHPLVYSDIPVPSNAEKIRISARFKNNFPENNSQGFYIGANDMEEWHYQMNPIYLPGFGNFSGMPYISDNRTRLYFLNNDSEQFYNIDMFINSIPKNSIIATEKDLEQKKLTLEDYKPSDLLINSSIRGSATLYVYAKNNLGVYAEKSDINWYEGEDPLKINVYDTNNSLMASTTIEDDGIIEATKKTKEPQHGVLEIDNIKEGVYKVQLLGTSDTIIREIKLNQNKAVFEGNLLLADNSLYNLTQKPTKIFLNSTKNSKISFFTYHKGGLQNITINNKNLEIEEINTESICNMTPGFYEIKSIKNDFVIKTLNYVSFTKDSYFEPFEYRVIGLDDIESVKENADYILTDYMPPVEDNGWLIGTAEFDAKDLYIKDNKLSIILNAKHLGNSVYENYTIPVDYINVSIARKGLIG